MCRGNIDGAELYAHVKPAMGGTCTDIAMWVFCPFNGPARLKLGPISLPLAKTGRHVGDWEHFTFRVSNLTSELMGVYYSQHSGGHWVDASVLEYIDGNRPVVYSSRNGHASYAYPGVYLQGSAALGVGIRNDAARSGLFVDSSARYRIVAAEYLGEGAVAEPQWLQFMREWGPTVVYKSEEADGVDGRAPTSPAQVQSGEHAEQDAQRAVQGRRADRAQGEEQLGGRREMVGTMPDDMIYDMCGLH